MTCDHTPHFLSPDRIDHFFFFNEFIIAVDTSQSIYSQKIFI